MEKTPKTDQLIEAQQALGTALKHLRETKRELETYDAMTVDRDRWKARFKKLDKELMCELRDPNGTIWEHAKNLQDQLDELRSRVNANKDNTGS
jgi:chaperonin cofactor prefoldin